MLAPDEDRDRRQKISDERDLIWEYAQHSARWREVSRLPEMEHFFVIQPLWFVCWSRKECEVPGPIASVIESDFARKKTSIDIPASPALRFGRCSIDFTVGKYGQIAVQQDSARDNKYGCVAHPPSGTYLLRRSERDESGGYFLTCVSYFHTLFRYLNKQHQLQLLLQGGAARSAQLRAEVLEAKAASKVLFRDMHLRYSRTLLAYKFASSCHERGFYEFLYLATMRILRKVFAAPKMHGPIEEIVNKMFRSDSFRFNFRKQQVDWEALAEYLHQNDWNGDEAEGEGDAPSVAGKNPSGDTPAPASPTRSVVSASTGDMVERKFTQLVCPPKRLPLHRAIHSRSMLVAYRYPDALTSVGMLQKKCRRFSCAGSGSGGGDDDGLPRRSASRRREGGSATPASPAVPDSPLSVASSRPPSVATSTRSACSGSAVNAGRARRRFWSIPKEGSGECYKRYQLQLEDGLMPHDQLNDVSLPYEVLSEYFNDTGK